MGPLGWRGWLLCSPVIDQPRSASGTGAVLVVTGEFGQQLIAKSMRNVDSGVTLPKMNGTILRIPMTVKSLKFILTGH